MHIKGETLDALVKDGANNVGSRFFDYYVVEYFGVLSKRLSLDLTKTLIGDVTMTQPRQPKHFNISLKRVYETPGQNDGIRILVERLWPRGLSKKRAKIDHWLKDVAPSPNLRHWFNHRPERWDAFQARYKAELDVNAEDVLGLIALIAEGPACFVFAARDTEHNSAVALKAYLDASIVANGPS